MRIHLNHQARAGERYVPLPFVVLMSTLLLLSATAASALDVNKDIVQKAQQYVGNRYCRGGERPPCFDCSGFVGYIIKPFVSNLPRVSRDMARFGSPVRKGELRPGDLVFFATTPNRSRISHVALYIGQKSIIHAISDGPNRGVNVTSIDARYWRSHYHSASRIFTSSAGADISGGLTSTVEPIRFAKGSYTGELKNGEPHGEGTLRLDNGDLYKGGFAVGLFEGEGVYTWTDGSLYRGEFEEGKISGSGVLISSDGSRRKGIWKNGELVEAEGEPEEISDKKEPEAAPAEPKETYLEKEDSPWEEWEGYITGDYYEWRQKEQEAFEEWKKKNQPQH